MANVILTGTLFAGVKAGLVRAALPARIALTRAKPGCLRFNVTEGPDGCFSVDEYFADDAAFQAHQARTKASDWWRITGHMQRDFRVTGP